MEIRNTVMKAKKPLPLFEDISMTVKKKRPGKDSSIAELANILNQEKE